MKNCCVLIWIQHIRINLKTQFSFTFFPFCLILQRCQHIDCVASNGMIIDVSSDLEGSGCDLQAFVWRNWGEPRKASVRMAGLRAPSNYESRWICFPAGIIKCEPKGLAYESVLGNCSSPELLFGTQTVKEADVLDAAWTCFDNMNKVFHVCNRYEEIALT